MTSRQRHREWHGMSRTPEYQAWVASKDRITNRNCPSWKNYGGRGLDMCAAWGSSFRTFMEAMGPRPSDRHTVDRKNNAAGYHCGSCEECTRLGRELNCRWATPIEQMGNTRRARLVTANGETMSLGQWAKRLGVTKQAISLRLSSGWDPVAAVTTAPNTEPRRRKTT